MANRFQKLRSAISTKCSRRLAVIGPDELQEAFERLREGGLPIIGEIVQNIYQTTAAQFAQAEYLQ